MGFAHRETRGELAVRWMALPALLACVAFAAGAAHALEVVETYAVNAQYRGAVKKGFRDLGAGSVRYVALDPATFRVEVNAVVRHPEERREFRFRIHETFRLEGRRLSGVRLERAELNAAARPHEDEVRELLPFAYLVRKLEAPAHTGGERSRTIRFRGHPYTIRYRTTERNEEAELYRGNTLRGKFFMEKGRRTFAALEKFRIWLPDEELMVSFIVTDSTVR